MLQFVAKDAVLLLTIIFFNANVNLLELKSVEEGACHEFPLFEDVNMTWVMNNIENIKYFGGTSKYNMYGVAAAHSTFGTMREFEFYYDSCFECSFNASNAIGTAYGFGDFLGDFHLTVTEPGVIYFVKSDQPNIIIRHQITLTDYETFIFFSNCWEDSNQRAWVALSLEPHLNEATKKTIEEHAQSMGFQREQFIFFRRETCPIS